MRPSPALLDSLARARLRIQWAEPSLRAGERRSRAKGAGLEFVDHRPYRSGDDIRHVDPRLMARLGEAHIRQYSVDRQLPVEIVLDASRSMRYGTPDKFAFARTLAQLVGHVAIQGGDRVRVAILAGERLRWSPSFHGANQTETLFDWLDHVEPTGTEPFARALAGARPGLAPASLLVLVSDWWTDDIAAELAALRRDGHEIVAIHVIAPEERDPARLGDGPHFIVDSETGERIEILLEARTLERYRAAFAARLETLRAACTRAQGRYLTVGTETDPGQFLLRDLRRAAVLA